MDDMILCPLVDEMINCVTCMENCDTNEEALPDAFKSKEGWKDICDSCPYHQI